MLLNTTLLFKVASDPPTFQEFKASFRMEHIIGVEEYKEPDPDVPKHQQRHSLIYLSNGENLPIKDTYTKVLDTLFPTPHKNNIPPQSEEDINPAV